MERESDIAPRSLTGRVQRSAAGVALVAGGVAAVVVVGLMVNFWNLRVVNPLESPELAVLERALADQPGNEQLRTRIREMDLQIRAQYLQRQRRADFGGALLLAVVIVALAALKLAIRRPVRVRVASAGSVAPRSEPNVVSMRRALAAHGGLLLVGFVALAFAMPGGARRVGSQDGSAPNAQETEGAHGEPSWPCFRGPGGLGVALDADQYAYPVSWDVKTGANVRWKTRLELAGKSSAVVWGDRVMCSGADGARRVVYCLDAATGEVIWERRVDREHPFARREPKPVEVTADTGHAASTPATDGRHVFVVFANGDLAAYDVEGAFVWGRALGQPENDYGHASSLLVYGARVIVQLDQAHERDRRSTLLALDARAGETAWRVERPVSASWTSPIVIGPEEAPTLVTAAAPWVIAYDPASGRERWRSATVTGELAPSPCFDDRSGLVFVASPWERLVALDPTGSGQLTDSHVRWAAQDDVPDIASPVAFDGFVYSLTTGGAMSCVRAENGEAVWRQEFDLVFHASPVCAGDRVYATGTDGTTIVVRAGERFEAVGRGAVGEPVDATPAFSRGRIYIRADDHLFCIAEAGGQP
ncbi:MAG: hypothetical protein CMJ18_13230 [Phycisphaeraceae bacterium]|nr:hypothetical protein [Phycisphaeraceae bacterium]